MSNLRRVIISFTYSFILILVWGVGFIDIDSDQITALLAFIFTYTSSYFMNKKMSFGLFEKLIVLSLPVLYFLTYVYIWESFSSYVFNNPLTIGLVFLVLSLTYLKDLAKPEHLFLFVFCTLMYTHRFYPVWDSVRNPPQIETIEDSLNGKINVVSDSIRLLDYSFINHKNENIKLELNGKYTLLETWSEGCPPCIKAFSDLKPFYKKHMHRLDSYYVYENRSEAARRNLDQILGFKHIEDKSKILVDIDQALYKETEMSGYPYFLLFNPDGDLVYSQSGYRNDIREAFEAKVLSKMGER